MSGPLSAPGQEKVTSSWHLLWTTKQQTAEGRKKQIGNIKTREKERERREQKYQEGRTKEEGDGGIWFTFDVIVLSGQRDSGHRQLNIVQTELFIICPGGPRPGCDGYCVPRSRTECGTA